MLMCCRRRRPEEAEAEEVGGLRAGDEVFSLIEIVYSLVDAGPETGTLLRGTAGVVRGPCVREHRYEFPDDWAQRIGVWFEEARATVYLVAATEVSRVKPPLSEIDEFLSGSGEGCGMLQSGLGTYLAMNFEAPAAPLPVRAMTLDDGVPVKGMLWKIQEDGTILNRATGLVAAPPPSMSSERDRELIMMPPLRMMPGWRRSRGRACARRGETYLATRGRRGQGPGVLAARLERALAWPSARRTALPRVHHRRFLTPG